jgi:hypothetical protein
MPKAAEASSVSETYELLRYAAARKQPVAATYDGQPRLLCPPVGGRKSGRLPVFCYQFGGSSNSVEPLAPEGRGVWRCRAVQKISQVELRSDAWHTEPRSSQPTCIDEVDFDTHAQPGDDPQKGPCGNSAATGVREPGEWLRSSVDYVAPGVRGDPRGRKCGAGLRAANPR